MGAEPIRPEAFGWPRLMSEPVAARYLSLSTTTLRESGPEPKRHGRRVLYDRQDLDRWADVLGGQPLSAVDEARETAEVERRYLEKLRGRH